MKKLLLFLFVSAAIAGCKKRYTCECAVNQTVMGYSQNVNTKTETPKMTKSEAKQYCETDAATNMGSAQQSVSCKLAD